jgi:hypothetical protein
MQDGKNYLAGLVMSAAYSALPSAGSAQWVLDLAKSLTEDTMRQKVLDGIDRLQQMVGCVDPWVEADPDGNWIDVCVYSESNPYTWGAPHPIFQARPAMAYVRLANLAVGEASQPGSPVGGVQVTGNFCYDESSPTSTPISCTKTMFPKRRQLKVVDYGGIYETAYVDVPNVIPADGVVIPVVLTPKLPQVTYSGVVNGVYKTSNTPTPDFTLDGVHYTLVAANGAYVDEDVNHQLIAPWLIKTYGSDIAVTVDSGSSKLVKIIDAYPGSIPNNGHVMQLDAVLVEEWENRGVRDGVDAEFEQQQLLNPAAFTAPFLAGDIYDGVDDGQPGRGDLDPYNGFVGEIQLGPQCPGSE